MSKLSSQSIAGYIWYGNDEDSFLSSLVLNAGKLAVGAAIGVPLYHGIMTLVHNVSDKYGEKELKKSIAKVNKKRAQRALPPMKVSRATRADVGRVQPIKVSNGRGDV